MQQIRKHQGWLFGLIAIFAYSTNSPIARGAYLAGMDPTTLLIARFGLASLLYSTTIGVMLSLNTGNAKQAGDVDRKPLDSFGFWVSLGTGLINGVVLVSLFSALKTVSASIASVTSVALIQIFTLVILTFRGEALTLRNMLRVAIGLIGLYFLLGLGGRADLWGVMLLLIGSLLFAVHIVSVQWFLGGYDTWVITTLIVVGGTTAIAGLWWLNGAQTFVPGWAGWVAIFFQGIITTFVGRILTYRAINLIGSGQYALLSPLETALTMTWGVLFLNERLAPIQWVGAGLILSSLILAIDMVWQKINLSNKK